ncbi:hypothetical protein IGK74_001119 [Enterococcus sp. AZ150]|uniref:hypothetical protein n=1 Tax=Enterococcus sp. AZ150 TaxID=2774866 RepID=UPI003F21ED9E
MKKPLKNIRPKKNEIGIGGIYQCKSDAFSHKVTIKIEKMYENSVLGTIVDCDPEDKVVVAMLSGKTIIAKKNIWFILQKPDYIATEKEKTVKRIDLTTKRESKKANTSAKGCVLIFPNGEREEFYSIKSATQILGVTNRTVMKSLDENRKVKQGKLKGCQFFYVSQQVE